MGNAVYIYKLSPFTAFTMVYDTPQPLKFILQALTFIKYKYFLFKQVNLLNKTSQQQEFLFISIEWKVNTEIGIAKYIIYDRENSLIKLNLIEKVS